MEILKKHQKIKIGKKNFKNKVFVETNAIKEPITVIIGLKNKKSRNKKINQQQLKGKKYPFKTLFFKVVRKI